MENIEEQLQALSQQLDSVKVEVMKKSFKDLIIVQNRIYAQLEALTWLSKALTLSGSLPPLRSWAASPDVLLRLHEYIRYTKPKVVVECGSGSSTLVMADALRQNGEGYLVSLEHSPEFGGKTRELLEREQLLQWVDLRIVDLEPWEGVHLNDGSDESVKWYASSAVSGVQNVDLLFVDGPPGATCKYARYPALPALIDRLAPGAQVWMDDTVRQEETDMAKDWAKRFGYTAEFLSLEKGLGVLTPLSVEADEGEVKTGELTQGRGLPDSLDTRVLAAFEQHLTARQPDVVLQFGVSSATLPLVRALKAQGRGRLICIAQPDGVSEGLEQRVALESLQSSFSLLPAELSDWPYQYPADCDTSLKRWYPESLLESLPELDWLIVDGPDWQGQPCTRYPALPSVMEQLANNAQVWMLGAQDNRVQQVAQGWSRDYGFTLKGPDEAGVVRLER